MGDETMTTAAGETAERAAIEALAEGIIDGGNEPPGTALVKPQAGPAASRRAVTPVG